VRKRIYELFSNDIGIDLGTAYTLVYVKGQGIIINEPSVVALNQKTGRIVAIGTDAKQMLGRTPLHIQTVRPLVEGVISNFEVTEEMLTYFLRKAEQRSRQFLRPRVIVGIPTGITNVERRAVRDAAQNAGAREVHLIEEPMSAALGIRLPIHEPVGTMIVDIGGGTTDIAIISLSGIVTSKNLRIAGDRFNEDIVNYVKDEFKLLLGEKTAEEVKTVIGSVIDEDDTLEATVRGRDIITGLPREVVMTDADVREAIKGSVAAIVDGVKEVIESAPPEVISDIMHRGIVLVGGGSLIRGIEALFRKELKIAVETADDPQTAVVRGMGVVLEDFDTHTDLLLGNEDDLPPT